MSVLGQLRRVEAAMFCDAGGRNGNAKDGVDRIETAAEHSVGELWCCAAFDAQVWQRRLGDGCFVLSGTCKPCSGRAAWSWWQWSGWSLTLQRQPVYAALRAGRPSGVEPRQGRAAGLRNR